MRRHAAVTPSTHDAAHTYRDIGRIGGPQRVHNHVVAPLARVLGYGDPKHGETVDTREGREDGGWILAGPGAALRTWAIATEADLDAPRRTGRAYRFSPMRSAQRASWSA